MLSDKVKALFFCLMIISSSFAEVSNAEDNTYYFNAEVTRYIAPYSDSWIYSSTLSTPRRKFSSDKSFPTLQMLSTKSDLLLSLIQMYSVRTRICRSEWMSTKNRNT